jgi:5-methylcytosine-specific restriction endonuclease McrA
MEAFALGCGLLVALGLLACIVSASRPSEARFALSVLDRLSRVQMFDVSEQRHERARACSVEPLPPMAAALRPLTHPSKPVQQHRLTQLMKKKIAARDGWACRRCRRVVDHTFEIDHIIAKSSGGSDHESNLRLLCRQCHGFITAEQRLT